MAQVEWSVRGRLLLVPQLKEIAGMATVGTDDGKAVPLAGVAVKVSALEFGLDPTGWERRVCKERDNERDANDCPFEHGFLH